MVSSICPVIVRRRSAPFFPPRVSPFLLPIALLLACTPASAAEPSPPVQLEWVLRGSKWVKEPVKSGVAPTGAADDAEAKNKSASPGAGIANLPTRGAPAGNPISGRVPADGGKCDFQQKAREGGKGRDGAALCDGRGEHRWFGKVCRVLNFWPTRTEIRSRTLTLSDYQNQDALRLLNLEIEMKTKIVGNKMPILITRNGTACDKPH